MKSVLLAAVILFAGCLATACAQSAQGAVTASSPSAGAPTDSAPPTPTPTVASPTTVPTTASPTAEPSTASTTPSPTPSSSSTSTGGFGGDLIWLWFVLGALVLLGIILLATRSPSRARRPSAAADNWRSRAVDVYAKGAAFDGAARGAERQGVFAEAAGARWADLQSRADDLSEALYAMRETAPTEHRRVQVENAILSLRAVRDAMDAERFPGETRSRQAGILSSRLSALESSLNALRVPDDPLM
jgi:hypothetical protein